MSLIPILYREELAATMRGRFAWLGAAVVLLGMGGLATVATQDTWLDGYGIVAYVLMPLAFIPLTAGLIASARANRFVESVFTAPVERRDWLAAKLLVAMTGAAAYYLSLVPMMLVYAYHVGLPPLLGRFLLYAPVLLVASVALGALVGVLFIGRSIAAPAATGMGVLLTYASLIPLQELMVAQGNGAGWTGRASLASPAVLLKNALGFTLVTGSMPATSARTWLCLFVLVIGALGLAVWVFLRAQGVETWESTRWQRWVIGAAVATLVVLPVLAADVNYDAPAPPPNSAPAIRGLFARAGSSVVLTDPGKQPPDRCCSTILNRDAWPLATDTLSRQDLLLFLPVDSTDPVSDLHVSVEGESGLRAKADAVALASLTERLEQHTYEKDLGPAAPDGHHVSTGWVARVPVTLEPTRPWDIGGDRYPLTVVATYQVSGENQKRTFSARGAVNAQVSTGIYEMAAAALITPLLCLGAALVRWRRTR